MVGNNIPIIKKNKLWVEAWSKNNINKYKPINKPISKFWKNILNKKIKNPSRGTNNNRSSLNEALSKEEGGGILIKINPRIKVKNNKGIIFLKITITNFTATASLYNVTIQKFPKKMSFRVKRGISELVSEILAFAGDPSLCSG